MGIPVVTLVGRPNVGKSSIFNLLIGRRKAIVDDIAGTTRDVNMELITWEGLKTPFFIVDTGGWSSDGSFSKEIKEKIIDTLEYTDLVLFVVDGKEGINPLDEEFAQFLRKNFSHKKIILVVNKVDADKHEDNIYEFYKFGIEEVLTLSTKTRRGYNDFRIFLEEFINNFEVEKESEEIVTSDIKIAIVGKPNVGKSSLLNAILGYERAIVSEIPGTTRDSIDEVFEYKGKKIKIIDTAGLRRKSKVDTKIEAYSISRVVASIEHSDVVVVLIDASSGNISNQDKKIIGLVLRRYRGLVLGLNKWDLIAPEDTKKQLLLQKDFENIIITEFPKLYHFPIIPISAKTGYNITTLLDNVLKVHENLYKRINTGKVNRYLQKEVVEMKEQPKGKLKIFYATQTDVNPPTFVFFVNDPELVTPNYESFLVKKLRLGFDFFGVPVKLIFKKYE